MTTLSALVKGTLAGSAAGAPMPGGPRTEAMRLVTGLDVCGGWPAGLMWGFGLFWGWLALAMLLGYAMGWAGKLIGVAGTGWDCSGL